MHHGATRAGRTVMDMHYAHWRDAAFGLALQRSALHALLRSADPHAMQTCISVVAAYREVSMPRWHQGAWCWSATLRTPAARSSAPMWCAGRCAPVDPRTGLALNNDVPMLPKTPSTPTTDTFAQAFAEY